MGGWLLETRGVSKHFGGLRAVDAVDFRLAPGEVRAIIGPNGAGKTTFFNLISGVARPSRGSILFEGRDITRLPAAHIARLGLARTFQVTMVFPGLTVYENVWAAVQARLEVVRSLFDRSQRRRIHERTLEVLDTLGLAGTRHRPASEISGGDQRVLEVALALAGRPKLLLLDEPTAGMSPAETENVVRLIQKIRESTTIAIVEHDMDIVMGLADRISVFDKGRLIAEGSADEIQANADVQGIYLGA